MSHADVSQLDQDKNNKKKQEGSFSIQCSQTTLDTC